MNKQDFFKGQTVYLKIVESSNAYRSLLSTDIENRIVTGTVISVGRKYITVKEHRTFLEYRFRINEKFLQYYDVGGIDYELFLTKEDALEDEECKKLYYELKKYFSNYSHKNENYNKLKKIKQILEEK